MEEHELIFCEFKFSCNFKKTLKKYMFRLVRAVEKKITTIVNAAPKFAVVFDGWSEDATHFIGLFITCPATEPATEYLMYLLSFSPLQDETNFNADNHSTFIRSTLDYYNLDQQKLVCLIGDNCNVNKSTANLLSLPLLGCRSHRFNLAVECYIKKHLGSETEIVSKLMSKLSTLKESGRLRLLTSLRPAKRNVTRWLGAANMFDRLEQLLPKIQDPSSDVAELIPNAVQINTIRAHKTALKDFRSITLKLQTQNLSIADSHVLFQTLILEYPNFDLTASWVLGRK